MNRAKETLCELLVLLTLAFFIGPVPSAPAKIGYMNEQNMIRYAEFIAIVDISHVERVDPKSAFNHTEIAYATVQQTLKGRLPHTVSLHGGTWFACAQDHFAAGRYLVFLVCDQDLLRSCNDYFGIRPINGTQVEWYVPGEPVPGEPRKLSLQPLDAVLQRIENLIAKPEENNQNA